MEGEWAQVGSECQCIRDTTSNPWTKHLGFGIGIVIPGPKFMDILTIQSLGYLADEDEGHRVKLRFADFDHSYCICSFVPLQKLEQEDEVADTAPVSKEHAPI